jgi:hypothetical protein
MRRLLLAGGLLMLAGVAGAAELNISHCEFPQPPVVPNGETATEEEMGQAGVDVREYVGAVQSSLECLAMAERAVQDELTDEQQAQLVGLYNSGVDQMNEVADEYNEQVREYLARE